MTQADASRRICVCLEFPDATHRRQIEECASALGFEVRFFDPSGGRESQGYLDAREYLQGCEVLFAHDPELARSAPETLRWYCCSFAGVDPYGRDPSIFANPDILVTNSSGAYDETIAEHLVMVVLMLLRRMPEYSRIAADRRWENQLPIRSILGSSITVLGAGNIGSAFARKARALGAAHLTGITRSGRAREPFDEVRPIDELDEILPSTQILVMALPGTRDTAGVLSAERIALMPKGAIVANVGRGSAIDQVALRQALDSGHLAGAALDVMTPEPLPADDPLWEARNVIITPHVSGNMTLAYTRDETVRLFCEDLENYAAGRPLARLVDLKAGY